MRFLLAFAFLALGRPAVAQLPIYQIFGPTQPAACLVLNRANLGNRTFEIGATWQVEMGPPHACLLALGQGRIQVPVACRLVALVPPILLVPNGIANGTTTQQIPVPADPALLGGSFTFQWWMQPLAGGCVIASNGCEVWFER